MPEETPGNSPGDAPASNGGQQTQQQTQQENWQEKWQTEANRVKGLNKVINDRDAKLQEATARIEELQEQVSSFESRFTSKEAEFGAKRQGFEEEITRLSQEKQGMEGQLGELKAKVTLFETLQGHPDLMPMAHLITPVDNPEAQKKIVEEFAKATSTIKKSAIDQVKSGLLPQAPSPQENGGYNYATQEAWAKAMREAAGTKEFPRISDSFRNWLSRN